MLLLEHKPYPSKIPKFPLKDQHSSLLPPFRAVYSLLLVVSREVKRLAPGREAMNQVSNAWARKKYSAHC